MVWMQAVMKRLGVLAVALTTVSALAQVKIGNDGGKAVADGAAGSLILSNHKIAARCSQGEQGLRVEFKDLAQNRALQPEAPFSILFADGTIVRADKMQVVERPTIEDLHVDAAASRAAERIPGKGIRAVL